MDDSTGKEQEAHQEMRLRT